MTPYAAVEDLKDYLMVEPADLPNDAERLLLRASELVEKKTLGQINKTDSGQMEAAKNATCAQVEYWMSMDESTDIIKPPNSIRIGSLSMDFGDSSLTRLAPRARSFLLRAGLLYSGVGMR